MTADHEPAKVERALPRGSRTKAGVKGSSVPSTGRLGSAGAHRAAHTTDGGAGGANAESPLLRALGHQEIGRLSREGDVS
jgi:hypothetical protein